MRSVPVRMPDCAVARVAPGAALAAACFGLLGAVALPLRAQERPPYRDPARSVDDRVRDLLGRMTLEEKVAQTLAIWKGKQKITNEQGQLDPAGARAVLAHGLGQIARPSELRDTPVRLNLGPRENALFVNAVQKW